MTRHPDADIDILRQLRALIRHWKLIVVFGVVAGIVSLLVTFLLPRTYQASAMVSVSRSPYQLNFDLRREIEKEQDFGDMGAVSRSLIALADSDQVLMRVLDKQREREWGFQTLEELRKYVIAKPSTDATLVKLQVQGFDAKAVADMANSWAQVLVDQARSIYGYGEAEIRHLEAELAKARERVDTASAALAEFAGRGDVTSLRLRSSSVQANLEYYMSERDGAQRLLEKVDRFIVQIGGIPDNANVIPSDELASMMLELEAYRTGLGEATRLELGGSNNPPRTYKELREATHRLRTSVKQKEDTAKRRIAELSPQAQELRGLVQQSSETELSLTTDRDLAIETYRTLQREVEKAQISDVSGNYVIRSAIEAQVVEEPMQSGRVVLAAAGTVVGMLLGIMYSFWVEYKLNRGAPVAEMAPREKGTASD